jgi:hypothetical protein
MDSKKRKQASTNDLAIIVFSQTKAGGNGWGFVLRNQAYGFIKPYCLQIQIFVGQ